MAKLENLVKVHTSSELRGLNKLLKSWTGVVLDFCKDDLENNCWWFNERATLSSLSGAAWRLDGWIALEEFSTTKRHGISPDDESQASTSAKGRCDLFVSHASNSFAMEAKQAWPYIGDGVREYKDAAAHAMKSAEKDARSLVADEANVRLGITFSAPRIPLKKVAKGSDDSLADPKMTREFVKRWIKNIELDKYDAWAYVFPAKCEGLVGSNGKNVFPGVLLTMNQVKRGHRIPHNSSKAV